jgi:hypothetical protein
LTYDFFDKKKSYAKKYKSRACAPLGSYIYQSNISQKKGYVKGAPFKTKVVCGSILGINRQTVTRYLDTGKAYKNKWVFSSSPLSEEKLSLWVIPTEVKDALVGDLLGDGHISRGDISKYPNANARLEFTFSVKNLAYLTHLKFVTYATICTLAKPTP